MSRKQIYLQPIGTIHTPFKNIEGMPIQPVAANGVKGYIELFTDFTEGLKDLEEISHITLLYYFHKISLHKLIVKPFMDTKEHGIFATKSPLRPNPIGLSTVKLLNIKQNIINVEMVDMLDGTPLLDIKPFFEKFDNRTNCKSGWLDKQGELKTENMKSDDRFKV